jgi:hypothetical protein
MDAARERHWRQAAARAQQELEEWIASAADIAAGRAPADPPARPAASAASLDAITTD